MVDTISEVEQPRDILDKLLTEAFFRPEQLSGLHAVYEKAALDCADEIEPYVSSKFSVSFETVRNATAGQVLNPVGSGQVWAVIDAKPWDGPALLVLDETASAIVMELLLGNDGSEAVAISQTAPSNVSLAIMSRMIESLCLSLSSAFTKYMPADLSIEEVTTKLQPDRLGAPQTPVVVADYNLSALGSQGLISVVILRSVLSPLRTEFAKRDGGGGIMSPGWTEQLESEITKTNVTLTAVLDEGMATLAEVAGLRVGQVVPLSFTPDSRVQVKANEEPILLCHFGHVDGAYTLQVDEFIDQQKEFIEGIMPN